MNTVALIYRWVLLAGAPPEDPIAARTRYIMQHKVDFQAKYRIICFQMISRLLFADLRERTRKKLPFLYALVAQFADACCGA